MPMKNFSIRSISLILVMLVMIITVIPVAEAAEKTSGKIRVAQIDLSNFYDYDRTGPIGGYGFEYLQDISAYTGWDYEYIPSTWDHALDMLEKGEIDFFGPAPMTPELQKRFDYCDLEVGLNYSVLCVDMENKQTAFNDYKALNGMTVGLLKDNPVNGSLAPYSKKNNFTVDIVLYDNQAALLKALHDHKIDAILTSSLEQRPTERVVARFAPTPYYFITAKGNKAIMGPLNDSMNQIKTNNPYYNYELQKKYYNWKEESEPIFTTEEKEYIKNAPALKTVYDPKWKPIEYYDETTGRFSGITSEFFQLLSKTTGLKFEFVKTNSYTESLGTIANKKADILCGIDNDAHWANKHNLVLSEPYLSASIVLVKNQKVKNLGTATAALSRDFLAATEYVKQYNPNMNIVYYNTPAECFQAVNKGEADITYANSYVAEELMKDPKLNKLSIVETVNLADEICIGISNTQDPLLVSILNKGINSISDMQMNNIIFKHTLNGTPKITLEYLIYKDPRYLIGALLILLLIVIGIMTFTIKVKNNHTKAIEKIAYTDNVTGSGNYEKFKIDAEAALKNAKGKSYAIVYLDLYKFSYINNTFGYNAGDNILAAVASILQEQLPSPECSARISADNFVCLVEYKSDASLAKKHYYFQKLCDEQLKLENSPISVNFISAFYRIGENEKDILALVGKADIAHKTVRDLHQGPIVFYDEDIRSKYLRDKELESSMLTALYNNEFLIYLQPKYDLLEKQLTGVEALVRWQHPTEGLIMPDQFISLFESNGFILKLDFYVYEKVLQMLRKWLDEGNPIYPVSVNVSKAHLANQQFVTHFKELVDSYQIPPYLIELELTESMFLNNAREAVAMIRLLKEFGFSISIDDFGSGYSSLNLLKDIPVDYLKLDKEFFRKDGMEEKDKIIVEGIISIAKDLQLKIISEGVETKDQIDFLLSVGCHMVQGFYFAKPMSVEEFEKENKERKII